MEDKLVQTSDTSRTFSKLQTPDGKHFCDRNNLRRLTFNSAKINGTNQGDRTWQPFVGGKNGHENFRQARFYKFRDKCVVFARNRKFANLYQ